MAHTASTFATNIDHTPSVPSTHWAPSASVAPTTASSTIIPIRATRMSAGVRSICSAIATKSTRSEEHTSELQSRLHLVCRLLLEKKKKTRHTRVITEHVDALTTQTTRWRV